MSDNLDAICAEYMARLEVALAGLPRADRQQITEQISEHIASARAALSQQTEAGLPRDTRTPRSSRGDCRRSEDGGSLAGTSRQIAIPDRGCGYRGRGARIWSRRSPRCVFCRRRPDGEQHLSTRRDLDHGVPAWCRLESSRFHRSRVCSSQAPSRL